MNPDPLSDAVAFLLQPAWTTGVFWLLGLASIAIALYAFATIGFGPIAAAWRACAGGIRRKCWCASSSKGMRRLRMFRRAAARRSSSGADPRTFRTTGRSPHSRRD